MPYAMCTRSPCQLQGRLPDAHGPGQLPLRHLKVIPKVRSVVLVSLLLLLLRASRKEDQIGHTWC